MKRGTVVWVNLSDTLPPGDLQKIEQALSDYLSE